ncbi:MAG: hypothetical protein FJX42_10905 [Alphaproteobacteria bacterium]|nr:hypothetical protein [Alphaproteobacteria bacterium]
MTTKLNDPETLQAIVAEGRRLGYTDEAIAEKLGINLAAIRGEQAEPLLPEESDDPGGQPFILEDEKAHSGIAKGLPRWLFIHLPYRLIKAILILIARGFEASYRRGFQQGYLAGSENKKLAIDPYKLRFGGFSLDRSPMPHCGRRLMSSLERLDCEHGGALAHVGLVLKEDDEKVH